MLLNTILEVFPYHSTLMRDLQKVSGTDRHYDCGTIHFNSSSYICVGIFTEAGNND